MLKKETITLLATLLKIKEADLTAAITDAAEKDLAIDDKLVVFTADEVSARDTAQQSIGKKLGEKSGETIGEAKGKELAAKLFKTKLGITDESKELDKIADLAVSKMAGDDALKGQVGILQKTIAEKEAELTAAKASAGEALFNADLLTLLPQNRSKFMETSEHLSIVKANLQFTDEGVKYKNEILRDTKTATALDKKAAIEHFYKTRPGFLENESGGGGRGGTDQGATDVFRTLGEVKKAWSAANPGKNENSEEANEHILAVIAKNPELAMTE